MAKTFSTLIDLQTYVQKACTEAINDTAVMVIDKLKECIDTQYYDDTEFYPEFYRRTETFLESAAYQLLSSNSAEIYVDTAGMHYKNSFDPETVVEWASQSMHGGDIYKTGTQDFWSVFIDWCNENLLDLLKVNLQKHGIKTK